MQGHKTWGGERGGEKSESPQTVHVAAVVTTADGKRGTLEGDMVWTSDDVTPPPVAGDALTESDFDYLGAYRLPTDDASKFQFAYGGIAGRKVNGRVRLFMVIDEVNFHGSILEFEVPDAPPSKDVPTAPQMSRVRWWGDVYGGRRGTYMTVALATSKYDELVDAATRERDPDRATLIRHWATELFQWIEKRKKSGDEWSWYEFPIGMSGVAGLLWDDASRRLFWTYYDFYNVAGRPDWGLGATTLRDETPEGSPDSFSADGPWRFACPTGDGWTAYGPWRGLSLIIRPDTGELIVSGSMMSGNASSPWGPNGYGGGRLPAPGAPWDVDLVQPIRYVDHYPMLGKIDVDGRLYPGEELRSFRRRTDLPHWEPTGTPALNINNQIYGYDSWREVDSTGSVVWIDNLNGKSGLVFAGAVCGTNIPGIEKPGHEWYATSANNYACPCSRIPAPVQITGPVSTGNFSYLLAYAVPDLLRVVAGEIADYKLEPTTFINLQKKWQVAGGSPLLISGNNAVGGAYFDRDERLLYLIAPVADYYTVPGMGAPFVHVFRIGGPATG